jgi:hypothetical protein
VTVSKDGGTFLPMSQICRAMLLIPLLREAHSRGAPVGAATMWRSNVHLIAVIGDL